jgi:hypothetical protein
MPNRCGLRRPGLWGARPARAVRELTAQSKDQGRYDLELLDQADSTRTLRLPATAGNCTTVNELFLFASFCRETSRQRPSGTAKKGRLIIIQ